MSGGVSQGDAHTQRRHASSWKNRELSHRSAHEHHSSRDRFPENKRHSTSLLSHEVSRGHRGFRPINSERSSSRTHSVPREEHRRDQARISPLPERSNFQWREKESSRHYPRPDCSESSRTRRPPLERNLLSAKVTPPPPPPIPTTEEVMGKLRDVTVQYVSCSYPIESAGLFKEKLGALWLRQVLK